jgi:uncharacterized membrane protein
MFPIPKSDALRRILILCNNKQVLMALLIDHLLVRDFGPYVILMNVCVLITDTAVILLRDLGQYVMLFTTVCAHCLKFSHCS